VRVSGSAVVQRNPDEPEPDGVYGGRRDVEFRAILANQTAAQRFILEVEELRFLFRHPVQGVDQPSGILGGGSDAVGFYKDFRPARFFN